MNKFQDTFNITNDSPSRRKLRNGKIYKTSSSTTTSASTSTTTSASTSTSNATTVDDEIVQFEFDDSLYYNLNESDHHQLEYLNRRVDLLTKQLNNLAFDTELSNQAWQINLTKKNGKNKNGFKLSSLGSAYTVDKPKLDDVPTAKKIYWKCEKKECTGRGISNGLHPPLVISKQHLHLPTPKRAELLAANENIKRLAFNTNDQPRAIYKHSHLTLSNDCFTSMPSIRAIRQKVEFGNKKLDMELLLSC